MPDEHLQRRAVDLAGRVDALAKALHASGVPAETSAQLLEQASAAVLQALSLELLLDAPRMRDESPGPETGLRAPESAASETLRRESPEGLTGGSSSPSVAAA